MTDGVWVQYVLEIFLSLAKEDRKLGFGSQKIGGFWFQLVCILPKWKLL